MNIYDNCILVHYINEKITAISDTRKTNGGTIVFGVPQSVKAKIFVKPTDGLLEEINETKTEGIVDSPKKTDRISQEQMAKLA